MYFHIFASISFAQFFLFFFFKWYFLVAHVHDPHTFHLEFVLWHLFKNKGFWLSSNSIFYCFVLYYTVLHYTVPYNTILYYTVLYCTILCSTIVYCTVVYCIWLYYTVLYSLIGKKVSNLTLFRTFSTLY